jgi:putative transposase
MDFDQHFDGRKIRVQTVVDTVSRFSPVIEAGLQGRRRCGRARTRFAENRLTESPSARRRHGVHQQENGPLGFKRGVTLDFSRAPHPTDNAFIESLNRNPSCRLL